MRLANSKIVGLGEVNDPIRIRLEGDHGSISSRPGKATSGPLPESTGLDTTVLYSTSTLTMLASVDLAS